MPSRKVPNVEKAYELFKADPHKPLSDWAREWECSHERVRQLREQAGFDPISAIDHQVAITVIDRIRDGKYGLTVRELYEDLPIGLEKFLSWMKEDPAIWLGVKEAQQYVEKQSWNPTEKQCAKCGDIVPIKSFGKTQKYKDGRQKVCKNCLENPSGKLAEIQKKRETLEKLRKKLEN
tara:strand:+ start:10427 stop:10960 length:534 start_codon:yes stop_codon:yes gene_type:complete